MIRNRAKTVGVSGVILFLFLCPFILESYYIHLAVLVFIYVMLTSSLRTVYISGQMSLGHAAFMGIGAYISAMIAKHLGWPPWFTIPLGGLSALVAGILIGLAFSRLRAIYFSMASLFFGIMVTSLVGLAPGLTGSFTGLYGIPRLFGFDRTPYYYFFLVTTLLTLLVLYRLEHSRVGMTFKSIAQSYLAASSKGINEGGTRVVAVAMGGFFAGLAGAGYAHYAGFIAPATFGVMPSVFLIVYLLAGGKGSFAGPIVGTVVLYLVPYIMGEFKGYAPFFQAGVIMAVIFLMPDGMVSLPSQAAACVKKLGERRRAARHAS